MAAVLETCGFVESDQLRDANLQLVIKPVARKVRRLVKSDRESAVERLAGVVEQVMAGEAVDPLDVERGPETADEAWAFLVLLACKYSPTDNILDDVLDRFQHGELSTWKPGDDILFNEGRVIVERWVWACGDDGIPWMRFFQDDTLRGDVADELADLVELAFGESIAEPGADEQAGPMFMLADWRERGETEGGDAPPAASPESVELPIDSPEDGESDLNATDVEILRIMLHVAGATNRATCTAADHIAEQIDPYWTRNNIKNNMETLRRHDFIEGKRGNGGGTWLTEKGVEFAKSFEKD